VTNGELLELAAKAAGVPAKELSNRYDCWEDHPILIGTAWNPLTDDGQALRLAVKLNLVVLSDKSGITTANGMRQRAKEFHQGDPYAATRRAIVRVAAEIGKNTELADYKAEIITQDRAQRQAGQEPVAWMRVKPSTMPDWDEYDFSANQQEGFDVALYASPQPAPVSLTDDVLQVMAQSHLTKGRSDPFLWDGDSHLVMQLAVKFYIEGARAIEAAHNIKAVQPPNNVIIS
jgi:hypothetical protein